MVTRCGHVVMQCHLIVRSDGASPARFVLSPLVEPLRCSWLFFLRPAQQKEHAGMLRSSVNRGREPVDMGSVIEGQGPKATAPATAAAATSASAAATAAAVAAAAAAAATAAATAAAAAAA